MNKFKVTGTYNGKRRSAEIEAATEGEAVMKVTRKFVGFVVTDAVALGGVPADDTPSPLKPVNAVERDESLPTVGAIGSMFAKPDKDKSSAQRFIYSCDQFIRLIRILSWMAVGFYLFMSVISVAGDPGFGFQESVLGALALAVIVVIAYAIIEFQVLFLRFMRECVDQLDKTRELRSKQHD